MRRTIIYLVIGVFFLIVNSTLFHALLPVGTHPDFLLIMVFYLAFKGKSPVQVSNVSTMGGKHGVEGIIISFLLGLIADTFSSGIIGITSFSLVCIFVITHMLSGRMQFDTLPVKAGGVFIMTLLKANISYLVLRMLLFDSNIPFYAYAVPSAVITALVSPLAFNMLDRIQQWKTKGRMIY